MHTRTKHTREKPLLCDYPGCGRRFAESSNLSKHKKIHEPEEECACSICGKTFRRKDQLRRHGKIHARKEEGIGRVGSLGGSAGVASTRANSPAATEEDFEGGGRMGNWIGGTGGGVGIGQFTAEEQAIAIGMATRMGVAPPQTLEMEGVLAS
jgi:hypothetical protein